MWVGFLRLVNYVWVIMGDSGVTHQKFTEMPFMKLQLLGQSWPSATPLENAAAQSAQQHCVRQIPGAHYPQGCAGERGGIGKNSWGLAGEDRGL